MSLTSYQCVAKTYYGLEPMLASELTSLGCDDIQISNRAVEFSATLEQIYRANLFCRTAIRILRKLVTFKFETIDDIYEQTKKYEWSKHLTDKNTFLINATVNSETATHSQFVTYRVKDGIADYFMENEGKRPSVSVANPDIWVDVHVSHNQCTISLDSSGESLHKRGYRVGQTAAPISEVLAAGMLMMAAWNGQTDFVDPMCGSGTILIEAALIALNIPPAIYRTHFAFEKWNDFDQELFQDVYDDDSQEREFKHHIYGYDIDPKAVAIAKANVKSAGLSQYITIECRDIKDFEPLENKTLMVTNPPYGERLVLSNVDLYGTIGTILKHKFTGNTAWLISSQKQYLTAIGLHPTTKIQLKNGALDCEFWQIDLFKGKRNEYKRVKGEQEKDNPRNAPRKEVDSKKDKRGDLKKDKGDFKKELKDNFKKGKKDDFKKGDFKGDFKKDKRGDFKKVGSQRKPRN